MEVTGSNLNSGLLEVEQVLAELRREGELLYAHTGFFAKVVCSFEIYVIGRNFVVAGPTLVNHFD